MSDPVRIIATNNAKNDSEQEKIAIELKLLQEDEDNVHLDKKQRFKNNKKLVGKAIKDFFLNMVVKTVTNQYDYTKAKMRILILFTNFEANEKECIEEKEIKDDNPKTSSEDKIYVVDLTKASKCNDPRLKTWLMILTSDNPKQFYGKDKIMDRAIDKIYEVDRELEKNKK